MIRAGETPCPVSQQLFGQTFGFLTLNKHLGGGAEYVDANHPVQVAVREAFEDVTASGHPVSASTGVRRRTLPQACGGWRGPWRSSRRRGRGQGRGRARAGAAGRGDGRTPRTGVGRAAGLHGVDARHGRQGRDQGRAEGFYVAILPEMGLGVALKVMDGASRASEAAIAQILIRLGALDPGHPAARARVDMPIRNWRGIAVGELRARAP